MTAIFASFEELIAPLRAELHRIYGADQVRGYPPVKIGLLPPSRGAEVRLWVQTPLRYVPGIVPKQIPEIVAMLERETPWLPPVYA